MASDPRFKKVQEAGADFLETARQRAEDFLRELSKAGDSTQERAHGAVDEVLEGSRKGTEQLVGSIRREISTQLGLLGLATKADLADLEARVTGLESGVTASRKAPAKKAAKKTTAKKAGGTAKTGPANNAGAAASTGPAQPSKAPGKKAAGAKKASAPAKKTAG
jgi:polyhydroxyalkanoate synthesis regulator phasin